MADSAGFARSRARRLLFRSPSADRTGRGALILLAVGATILCLTSPVSFRASPKLTSKEALDETWGLRIVKHQEEHVNLNQVLDKEEHGLFSKGAEQGADWLDPGHSDTRFADGEPLQLTEESLPQPPKPKKRKKKLKMKKKKPNRSPRENEMQDVTAHVESSQPKRTKLRRKGWSRLLSVEGLKNPLLTYHKPYRDDGENSFSEEKEPQQVLQLPLVQPSDTAESAQAEQKKLKEEEQSGQSTDLADVQSDSTAVVVSEAHQQQVSSAESKVQEEGGAEQDDAEQNLVSAKEEVVKLVQDLQTEQSAGDKAEKGSSDDADKAEKDSSDTAGKAATVTTDTADMAEMFANDSADKAEKGTADKAEKGTADKAKKGPTDTADKDQQVATDASETREQEDVMLLEMPGKDDISKPSNGAEFVQMIPDVEHVKIEEGLGVMTEEGGWFDGGQRHQPKKKKKKKEHKGDTAQPKTCKPVAIPKVWESLPDTTPKQDSDCPTSGDNMDLFFLPPIESVPLQAKLDSSRNPKPVESGEVPDIPESEITCPDYFKFIEEDLAPWVSRGGVSFESLEAARPGAAFRVQILGGKVYAEQYKECFQTRANVTIWGILNLVRRYPTLVPDVDMLFDCWDWPLVRRRDFEEATHPPLLFKYCSTPEHMDVPWPDWSFWGWPELQIKPWREELPAIVRSASRRPFMKKTPLAFWKGSTRVGTLRSKLLKCSGPEFGTDIQPLLWDNVTSSGSLSETITKGQCRHRYRLYLEGNMWSTSLKYIMACKSAMIAVRPKYYDFYSRGLLEGRHWVNIDRENMCEAIKEKVMLWNRHPGHARTLALSGLRFLERSLTMDFVYDYMLHLLRRYAGLQRFQPTKAESAELVEPEKLLGSLNLSEKAKAVLKLEVEADQPPCQIL